ncbi:hypothetical protein EfmAA242_15110 [Enterococcus faecium]|nr:hypothetical protein EfmAA242_15110 [Enterococcus faecium]
MRYSTREEALSVIERLRNEGYERDDIVIYTTDEAASRLIINLFARRNLHGREKFNGHRKL